MSINEHIKPMEYDSRWRFAAWQQWMEWFTGGYNWRNFDLINIGIEATGMGSVEVTFGALGLYAQVEFTYSREDREAKLALLKAMRDDVIDVLAAAPSLPEPRP